MDGKGRRNDGKGSAGTVRRQECMLTVAQWPGRREVKVWSM